jgi:hypothetical protein
LERNARRCTELGRKAGALCARRALLTLGYVNGDERIRDVALLCDECYTTRASGLGESVKFERGHDESAVFFVSRVNNKNPAVPVQITHCTSAFLTPVDSI